MTNIVDLFNRATLGSAYQNGHGNYYDMELALDDVIQETTGATGAAAARRNDVTFHANQYAESEVHTLTDSNQNYLQVHVRMQSANSNCYVATAHPLGDGTVDVFLERKTEPSTFTAIGSTVNVAGAPSAGDKLRLEVVGSELKVYWKGVLRKTETDSNLTTGQPAIGCFVGTSGDKVNCRATAFKAGDHGGPILSAQSGAALSSTTARGTVTSDIASDSLNAVITQSAITPTEQQISVGQDHTGASVPSGHYQAESSAVGVNTLDFTNLTPDTTYWIHFAQQSGTGGPDSEPVSSASFVTTIDQPNLSNPTDTANSWDKCNATVDSDQNGGTIEAVVTESSTTPSHAQILAGQDHTGAAAAATASVAAINGTNNLSFTGLDANTSYWTHFTQDVPAAPDPVSADGFTTGSNSAPSLDSQIPNQTAQIDSPYIYDASQHFSDPDGDPLSFSATGLPDGLAIDEDTGVISGTPTGL